MLVIYRHQSVHFTQIDRHFHKPGRRAGKYKRRPQIIAEIDDAVTVARFGMKFYGILFIPSSIVCFRVIIGLDARLPFIIGNIDFVAHLPRHKRGHSVVIVCRERTQQSVRQIFRNAEIGIYGLYKRVIAAFRNDIGIDGIETVHHRFRHVELRHIGADKIVPVFERHGRIFKRAGKAYHPFNGKLYGVRRLRGKALLVRKPFRLPIYSRNVEVYGRGKIHTRNIYIERLYRIRVRIDGICYVNIRIVERRSERHLIRFIIGKRKRFERTAVVLNFQKKLVVRLFNIRFVRHYIVRKIFIAVLFRKCSENKRPVHNRRTIIYVVSAVGGKRLLLPLCIQHHIAHIEIQYPVGIRHGIGRIEIPARKDIPHPCWRRQSRHTLCRVCHICDGRVRVLRYKGYCIFRITVSIFKNVLRCLSVKARTRRKTYG